MPAGQNHSNFALNKGLSAPRYDTWCKVQVICFKQKKDKHSFALTEYTASVNRASGEKILK